MADRTYTPEDRRNALREYLIRGTYKAACEATGVPYATLVSWKHTDREWWDRTCNELITEIEGDYRPGWVRVLGKAMEAIEDRIEHGDHTLTKEGLVRVPIKGKELGVIMGIAADKLKQFGVKPAVTEDVQKRRKDLADLAKKDREEAQKQAALEATLVAMPVNKPVVQLEATAN